jgi:ketosteroid isomerase-like protein
MPNGSFPEADADAIQKVLEESCRDLKDGNFKCWISHWAEDAVAMPPHRPRAVGHEAILEFGKSFPKIRKLELSDFTFEGGTGQAVITATFHMTVVGPDGNIVEDTGKQMAMLRKQSDGAWTFTKVIFNSDLPA